jgi:ATP-dependent DNA ligase
LNDHTLNYERKTAGRPQFYDLMRRRGPFALVAFDVLVVNGKDVRALRLVERTKLRVA